MSEENKNNSIPKPFENSPYWDYVVYKTICSREISKCVKSQQRVIDDCALWKSLIQLNNNKRNNTYVLANYQKSKVSCRNAIYTHKINEQERESSCNEWRNRHAIMLDIHKQLTLDKPIQSHSMQLFPLT